MAEQWIEKVFDEKRVSDRIILLMIASCLSMRNSVVSAML